MRELRLSPKARADLDTIWIYAAAQWNEAQAEAYLSSLDHAMQLLCFNPMMGMDMSHVRKGYRKFPAGSHMLFYQLNADTIDIIRILHKSMDAERHL
jgi:toxin ParE1/3/4